MLVGENWIQYAKSILAKTTPTLTVMYRLIQRSLPILNSSCTGVISERHSSLGAKQGERFGNLTETCHTKTYQHNIIQKVCVES